MDRQIVYPGAIPLDTDLLTIERNTMVALGYLGQAVFGQAPIADGLSCIPTTPASMSITIGPGCITQFTILDGAPFGSLPAAQSVPLVKMGINIAPTAFALAAPTGTGMAMNYLVEASFLESDTTPVILPYYNAANPAVPYSGPANSGSPQNTQRLQSVQIQVKAGTPAATGQQNTPPVDDGWSGLYVITVSSGQQTITAANIALFDGAPFLPWKLGELAPGVSRMKVFTPASQGEWLVPAGVTLIKARAWGGGGAGGAGFGGGGGGGAGGGYAEGYFPVVPGETLNVTVGSGGSGQGTAGSGSGVGTLLSASGGAPGGSGGNGTGGLAGGVGGAGSGGALCFSGQGGGAAFEAGSVWVGGRGGAAYGAGGVEAVIGATTQSVNGNNADLPGCGGGGGVGAGLGGYGGTGLVILEW